MDTHVSFGNWLMVILLVASLAVSGWFLLVAAALLAAELVFDLRRRTDG